MTNKAAESEVNISPLIHEAVIDAPLAEVWNVWATSEGLRAWMAPHAEIDLRVGGLMRANYNPDGQLGDSQTIVNTVLSFEPQRMISIKQSGKGSRRLSISERHHSDVVGHLFRGSGCKQNIRP